MRTWENELRQKHRAQIQMHEAAFGKLGQLQTEEQRVRLQLANQGSEH